MKGGASPLAQKVKNLPPHSWSEVKRGHRPAFGVQPNSRPCCGEAWEDPLKEEMAIHCSILARRIPWLGKSGGLQSAGLQRVGPD